MKRFKFPLETVLRQKEWREKEAQKALGDALAQQLVLKKKLKDMEEGINALWTGGFEGEIDCASKLVQMEYGKSLLVKFNQIALAHEQQEKVVAVQTKVLAEAMRARKVMEKMKEKSWMEYRVQVGRAEAKTADEMASSFFRRAGEGLKTGELGQG